ncbi:MAG: hypothetical protein WC919_05985 [Candidatus Paceibacterota bacterium]|jgi:hypothetical protein
MDDLIEALTILRKYGNPSYPTNCTHDELMIAVSPDGVSPEDLKRLEELGVQPNSDGDSFYSFKFGSC